MFRIPDENLLSDPTNKKIRQLHEFPSVWIRKLQYIYADMDRLNAENYMIKPTDI